MAVRNRAELEADILLALPDNATNEISAADVRGVFTESFDSFAPYAGVMNYSGAEIENINITGTPQALTQFDTNATSANVLLEADQANNRILCDAPGLYVLTYRLQAKWSGGEDLLIEARINGNVNTQSPVSINIEGSGNNDPQALSFSRLAWVIQQDAVTNGPGGRASTEIYWSSTSGPFLLDQISTELSIEYVPLTIRTVG